MDEHIASIQDIYKHKCTLMLDALDCEFPGEITYTRPEGGLFIWCTLPDSIDANSFIKAAAERNVRVVPGATFDCNTEAKSNSFRLNFSTPSDKQITNGIKILGQLAKEML